MKNFRFNFGMICCCIVFTLSCNDDFLETTPLSEFSSADVWKDEALSKTFINGIYYNLEHGFNKFMKSVFVDEGHRRDNTSVLGFNRCLMNADDLIGWQRQPVWSSCYSRIRACNLFLAGVDVATYEDKDAMIGEVKFLRAWEYFHLTGLYGGVPIIRDAYGLDDEFIVPRDSYEDCINFIVEDLDEAARLLPVAQSDKGRVTKGAALALKSRVLLHAASDLHNTFTYPEYSNPELLGYLGGSQAARWQAAKDAAKAVIDLGIYSLYKQNPAPTDSIAENYAELFLSKGTEEDIWLRYYTTNTIPNDNNLAVMNGPNGYGGQGNNAVIGNLVDDFEMKDGTPFDWNNPDMAAFPYRNREPRFYANILYEGAPWSVRPAYSAHLDPYNVIHVGYFERWDSENNKVVIEAGIDSRSGPFQPGNSGQTLYLCRKMLDPNTVAVEGGLGQEVPWRHMRYAEVLLNYAEACIELGQDAEARTYINMIRKRAGMPDITEEGDALRKRYRHERRIEMMYEDQRFFDVRRWVIGPEAYNIDVYKANVLYELLPDKTTSPVPTIFHEVLETRNWDDKAYFFPILRSEMNKNSKLVQNPGY